MPLLSRAKPVPQAPDQADDLLTLPHVSRHTSVRDLHQRRADIQERLTDMASAVQDAKIRFAQEQQREAYAISQQGDAWVPPLAWREAKSLIAELEDQERSVKNALPLLSEQIAEAESRVRRQVDAAVSAALIAPLRKMIAAIEAVVPHANEVSRLIHTQRRLTGQTQRQHLVVHQALPGQILLFQRSLALLERGQAQGEGDAQ